MKANDCQTFFSEVCTFYVWNQGNCHIWKINRNFKCLRICLTFHWGDYSIVCPWNRAMDSDSSIVPRCSQPEISVSRISCYVWQSSHGFSSPIWKTHETEVHLLWWIKWLPRTLLFFCDCQFFQVIDVDDFYAFSAD